MTSKLKKKKKAKVKLEIPAVDLKDLKEVVKYEKLKHQKLVLDVKKINLKKKALEFKINPEQEKKQEKKPEEKPRQGPEDNFLPAPSFESATHDSSPLIKKREEKRAEEEKPVRNMETFLEKLPTTEDKEKEVKEEKRYSLQRRYDQNPSPGYEKRDEWTENKDFHESTNRVVLFENRNEGPRVRRVITDPGLEKQEFRETEIAKYEIISEHSSELDKYKRRRKT